MDLISQYGKPFFILKNIVAVQHFNISHYENKNAIVKCESTWRIITQ